MIKMLLQEAGFTRQATGKEANGLAVSGVNISRNATVGAATLVVAEVAPGNILARTGSIGAYADTTPTAALLTAANPDVADGESYLCRVSNRVAFIETITAGAGVTFVAGSNTTIAANSSATLCFTRTSATAWTIEII